MHMLVNAVGYIVTYILINSLAWMFQSPCRFGWYNKNDEERGRILRETYESRK